MTKTSCNQRLVYFILFSPITVIHLFVCVYECYNDNVHDNLERELSGNPNGLIEESPCLQLSEL